MRLIFLLLLTAAASVAHSSSSVSLYRFSQQEITWKKETVAANNPGDAVADPFVVYVSGSCEETRLVPTDSLFSLVASCDAEGNCQATPTPEVYKPDTPSIFCLYAGVASGDLEELGVQVEVLPFQLNPSSLLRVDQPESGSQYPVMSFAADELIPPMQYIFYTIAVDAPATALLSMFEATRLDFFLADGSAGCQAGAGGSDAITTVISALDWTTGGVGIAASPSSSTPTASTLTALQYRVALSTGDVSAALIAFANASLCVVDSSLGRLTAAGTFVAMLSQSPQFATLLVPTSANLVAGQTDAVVFSLTTLGGLTRTKAASSLQLRVYDVTSVADGTQCKEVEGAAYATGTVSDSAAGVLLSFAAPVAGGKALLCLWHTDSRTMLHFHEHISHYGIGLPAPTHLPVVVTINPVPAGGVTAAPVSALDTALTTAGIKQVHLINGAEGELPLSGLVTGSLTTLVEVEGNKAYYVDCAVDAVTTATRCPQTTASLSSDYGVISHQHLAFRKAFTIPPAALNDTIVAKCLCARSGNTLIDMQISLLLTQPSGFNLPSQGLPGRPLINADSSSSSLRYTVGDEDLGILIEAPVDVVGGYYALLSTEESGSSACSSVTSISSATQLQQPNSTLWLLKTIGSVDKLPSGDYTLCFAPEVTSTADKVIFFGIPYTVYQTSAPTTTSSSTSSSATVEALDCKFWTGEEEEVYLKLPCSSSAVMLKCNFKNDESWWSSVPEQVTSNATSGSVALPCDTTTTQGQINCMWAESKVAIDASEGIVLFQTRSATVQQACADSTNAPTKVDLQFTMGTSSSSSSFSLAVSFHIAMVNQQSSNPWLWSTASSFSTIPSDLTVYHAVGGVPMRLSTTSDGCDTDATTTMSSFYLNVDRIANTKLPNLVLSSGEDMRMLYLCLYVPLTGKWASLTQRNRQDPDMKSAKQVFVLESNNETDQTVAVSCGGDSSSASSGDTEETSALCSVYETEFLQVTQRCLGAGKQCSLLGLSTSEDCYTSQIVWTGENYVNLGNNGQLSIASADVLSSVRQRLTSAETNATFYWCTKTKSSTSGALHWSPVVASKLLDQTVAIHTIDVPELDSLRHLSLPLRNAESFDLVLTDEKGSIRSAGLFVRTQTTSTVSVGERCAPANRLGSYGAIVTSEDGLNSHYPTLSFSKTSTSPTHGQLTSLGYTADEIAEGPILVDLCVSALTVAELNTAEASATVASSQQSSSLLVPGSVSIQLSSFATPLTNGIFIVVYYALDQVHYNYEDPTSHVFSLEAGQVSVEKDILGFLESQPEISEFMKSGSSEIGTSKLGIRAVGSRTFRIYIPTDLVGGRQISIDATQKLYAALKAKTMTFTPVETEWVAIQVEGYYLSNQSMVSTMPKLLLLETSTSAPEQLTDAPLDGADGMNGTRVFYAFVLLVIIPAIVAVLFYKYKVKQREDELQAARNVEEGRGLEGKEGSPTATEMAETPHISPSPIAKRPAVSSAAVLLGQPPVGPKTTTTEVAVGTKQASAVPLANTNDTGENPLYDDPESRETSTYAMSAVTSPVKDIQGATTAVAVSANDNVVEDPRAESSSQGQDATTAGRISPTRIPPTADERDPLASDTDEDDAR